MIDLICFMHCFKGFWTEYEAGVQQDSIEFFRKLVEAIDVEYRNRFL